MHVIILVESDVLGQAEPGGQGVHVVAPALLYVPAVHAMGLLVVVGHLDPGGH